MLMVCYQIRKNTTLIWATYEPMCLIWNGTWNDLARTKWFVIYGQRKHYKQYSKERHTTNLSPELKGVVCNLCGCQVGGHDEDGFFALNGLAFAVRQPAFVKQLEQDSQDVGVGLVHLVK